MNRAMSRQDVMNEIQSVFLNSEGNTEPDDSPLAGLTLFEPPLAGIASAQDLLFEEYKRDGVIGPWFAGPAEWLPGAVSVISIFFPFTERVRESNRGNPDEISPEWLHGRVEGQKFISNFTKTLCQRFEERKIRCCAPCIDERFRQFRAGQGLENYPSATGQTFGSNWSERHAAYACGLGTFGLSRGIITAKGMAGRLTSVIVDVELETDERPYKGLDDYCIHCGACIRRCPVKAISREGKAHIPCSRWQDHTSVKYAPRYGCGKCQTGVPCEARNPSLGRTR